MLFTTNRVVKGEPHWHSYFLCGVLGVLDMIHDDDAIDGPENTTKKAKHDTVPELRGMNCFVSGNVPPSAGLSSSSALVCAAAIAFAHTNATFTASMLSLERHRTALAEMCARCERYIGTEGGGMDQAIVLLATQGRAKLIEFNPLVTRDVTLPPDATFVVANSLVKANKAATSTFNHRVMECRLAAKVLAVTHNIDPSTILKLIDIQRALNQSIEEIIVTTKATFHEEAYSVNEVASLLHLSLHELESTILSPHSKVGSPHATATFYLRQRALHVFQGSLNT